jgi:hypothetical protein
MAKSFKLFVEEMENEALDIKQRRAVSRRMKTSAMQSKIRMGRKRAERKIANKDVLMRRARKAARNLLLKKWTKDKEKSELSFQRRQELEKKLDKMGTKITQIARKQLPALRKKELAKKRGGNKKDD